MEIFFYSLILFVFSPLSFSDETMKVLVADVLSKFCSTLNNEGWTDGTVRSDEEIDKSWSRLLREKIKKRKRESRGGYPDIEFGSGIAVQAMKKALDGHEINSEHAKLMKPYLESLHQVKHRGSMLGLAMVFMKYVDEPSDEPSDDISRFAEVLAKSMLQVQLNRSGGGYKMDTPSSRLDNLNDHLRKFGDVKPYSFSELHPKLVDYFGRVK